MISLDSCMCQESYKIVVRILQSASYELLCSASNRIRTRSCSIIWRNQIWHKILCALGKILSPGSPQCRCVVDQMHCFVEHLLLYQTDLTPTLVYLGFPVFFSASSKRRLLSRNRPAIHWKVCSPERILTQFSTRKLNPACVCLNDLPLRSYTCSSVDLSSGFVQNP